MQSPARISQPTTPQATPVYPEPVLSRSERISLALAESAYLTDTVRVVNPGLAGFSHLVASRQGLFAVDENRVSLVANGMFFGLTLCGASIYAFESCDLPRSDTGRGRIVRLARDGDAIVRGDVVAKGLDNGCHQMDFIDGRLHLLDTYNQRLLRCLPDGTQMERLHPLPPCGRYDWSDGYVHANSLLRIGDTNLLLLHRGGERTGLASTVALFDPEWRPLDSLELPGQGCHNLAVLEDGTLLSCGSVAGELITLDGRRMAISTMMTRGLSVGVDSIAVGASTYSSRRFRHLLPGTVTFLDRSFRIRSVLDVPGAPTDIRRLDGHDCSLSSHFGDDDPGLKRR